MSPLTPSIGSLPKILIVDDEVTIGELLQDILDAYDFESKFAEDKEQAVQIMKEFNPTVALVDYRLGNNVTGFDVAKELKELDEDIPIIILTAYPSLELAMKAMHNEIYDFLAKPVDKAYLIRSITKAAEKRMLIQENKRLIASLKESNQTLDKLNRMKSKFLSIVTHDLRTPLAAIQGYAEVLQSMENLKPEEENKCLHAISAASERMKGLINNLMDMVSIESGKLRIEKSAIDYIAVCNEVKEILVPVAHLKKMRLEWELPAAPLKLLGDSNRLVQVLTNLISNAFKHTPENGKIKVKVSLKEKFILTEITDTGEGIAQEHLNKIFEQYYQVETSESKREGIGLGLSITKEIVTAHQGEIGAQSQGLSKGSAFWFTLPIP
ncbi:MAG: response regulator [Elusimicrobia bacterium]|nr:response regulator [Elusimicrobiota bacterium]